MQKLYGLVGYPLTHSFSKQYFTHKFLQENIDAVFENFTIADVTLFSQIIANHPNLVGLAVTIPYKKTVVNFLHHKTTEVSVLNACNCIKINHGILYGHNTDWVGFEKSFLPLLQPHHTKALVLGTGGAAQAIKYVLEKNDITYLSVSREASANTIQYTHLTKEIMQEYSIIINTTPLGTYPAINEAPPIPYQFITSNHYLYDVVYNPAATLFLTKGKENGALIKNGYDMLVIQAEQNWKIWNSEL